MSRSYHNANQNKKSDRDKRGYFGVPNPDPPKLEVLGCPKVVTLPKLTRLFSFGLGPESLFPATVSFASGLDRSGE
jgi:hypothetical protein